ncbi:MAG: calcium/proton exchanger [Candidatus Thalassarchaeaceae archaeon]|nr:calcium/proton exchanger [Candidatus Thalassarchaeaceae archaeon]
MSEAAEVVSDSEKSMLNSISTIITACDPRNSMLNWLLIAVPIAGYAKLAHLDESIQFIFSMIGIMPLAFLMGKATEEIATRTSESVGGLLNATFGNAAEIIIAIVAVFAAASAFSENDIDGANAMITLVKTSLIGSILGNLLLVMGLSFLWGGLRHKEQMFNPQAVSINTTLLLLSTICLILPTVFHIALSIGGIEETEIISGVLMVSRLTAIVLMVSYALLLFFQLKTHSDMMSGSSHDHEEPTMELRDAGLLLLIATVFVSLMAEIMVHSVEAAGEAIGLSAVFIGVILLPLFGNAAEHFTAVVVAGKNRMDLSIGIAVGSSVQIAAFVAPLVILVSWIVGVDLSFEFGLLETAACLLAVLIANSISRDGQSNWMEGAMLLATYVIIGLSFLFYP